ncbi:hypothetical protein KOI35_43175 [Actinoplanes bogorensis]|uniref:Uncharacterized protein n=1 Tax=Paractinoplanes bogorensis TaxID=1610840 RepID=A0ABS5Z4M0_9ACTN|nr:hypothetical protein [Actinoplanes bogorensis]MBU2670326.1 hypothetical protein [Actinoplanes bogorensis]
MTQHLRRLLDDAVSGVEPATPDPVAAVVRRKRSRRRRTVLAAAVTTLAVALGGVAVAGSLGSGPPIEPAAPERPSSPVRVVDGAVVVGALRLPVPPGWKVVEDAPGRIPCSEKDKIVLIVTPDSGGCGIAGIEVRTEQRVPFPPAGVTDMGGVGTADVLSAPISLTLPGGEPAWLMSRFDSEETAPGRGESYSYWNTVVLPWSKVTVTLRVDGPTSERLVETMTTHPAHAGVLALPGTVTTATLTVPDSTGTTSRAGRREIKDQKTIGSVLRLLREHKTTVPNGKACASPEQPALRLELDRFVFHPSTSPDEPKEIPAGQEQISVVVTLGDSCPEAVSAAGGRVRFDDNAVRELKKLFGLGAR